MQQFIWLHQEQLTNIWVNSVEHPVVNQLHVALKFCNSTRIRFMNVFAQGHHDPIWLSFPEPYDVATVFQVHRLTVEELWLSKRAGQCL